MLYCIVPYRSQRVCSEQQVWCGTLRYGTSKYSRVNTGRADGVSLQVVQCIAEGDVLSAESVGGMSTPSLAIFHCSPLPKSLKSTCSTFRRPEEKGRRCAGDCKDKENCSTSMTVLVL